MNNTLGCIPSCLIIFGLIFGITVLAIYAPFWYEIVKDKRNKLKPKAIYVHDSDVEELTERLGVEKERPKELPDFIYTYRNYYIEQYIHQYGSRCRVLNPERDDLGYEYLNKIDAELDIDALEKNNL